MSILLPLWLVRIMYATAMGAGLHSITNAESVSVIVGLILFLAVYSVITIPHLMRVERKVAEMLDEQNDLDL